MFWLQEGKCWVVVRRGFPSPGTAKEQHVAAELAAKAFGCTVASLELQPKTLKPARRYRFVHYHSKDKKWYVAQCGFHEFGFDTEEAAAKAAAKSSKRPLADLLLPKPLRIRTVEKVELLRSRFQQIMNLYSTACPKRPLLPGDLTDLLCRRPRPMAVFKASPGLVVPFLIAKYGPHRDTLLCAARIAIAKSAKDASPEDLLFSSLQEALRNLSGQVLSSAWTQNVGRKNCHHSGLVRFAQTGLKMLRPGDAKSARGAEVVRLGLNQRRFVFCALSPDIRRRLLSLIVFGQALLQTKATTSVSQWSVAVCTLQQSLKVNAVAGFTGPQSYRALWVIRLWLIWQMRSAGVPCLQLAEDCTTKDFATLFPDQKRWILRLAGRTPIRNISGVLKACGYVGPPELFSMFGCLFGDSDLVLALQRLPPDWLSVHRAFLTKDRATRLDAHRTHDVRAFAQAPMPGTQACAHMRAGAMLHIGGGHPQVRQEYQKARGMVPHPAVLVAEAVQQLTKRR